MVAGFRSVSASALLLGCASGAPSTPTAQEGWRQLAVGYAFLCALDWDGRVACTEEQPDYGWSYTFQHELPDGVWTSLSASDGHACALDAEGAVYCWGDKDAADPYPTGPASSVNAMIGTCLVDPQGDVVCDGPDIDPDEVPPTGVSGAVTGKGLWGCVLRDGEPQCFHPTQRDPVEDGVVYWPDTGGPADVLEVVPGEYEATVFVRANGQFGMYAAGFVTYPPAPMGLTQLGFDGFGACGLQPDGHAWCYTPDPDERSRFGITPTPDGTFTSISVGSLTACALSTAGEISCWSTKGTPSDRDPPLPDPSTLTFADGSTEP